MSMDPRFGFLGSAAKFYSTVAPEASSYLMNQRHELTSLEHQTIHSSNRACQACGAFAIQGWNIRSQRRANTPDGVRANKILETHCLRCYRFTQLHISTTKRVLLGLESSDLSVPLDPFSISIVKTASKRRAKKNRKQGGLRELLAKSIIKSDEPSHGLGLMDLMKKV
ncbi:MAG: hypothetical protein Q9187_003116 [Circinaria calcarea]